MGVPQSAAARQTTSVNVWSPVNSSTAALVASVASVASVVGSRRSGTVPDSGS